MITYRPDKSYLNGLPMDFHSSICVMLDHSRDRKKFQMLDFSLVREQYPSPLQRAFSIVILMHEWSFSGNKTTN